MNPSLRAANMPPSYDLKGQVAIVTGSNTGIGKETAGALCAAGAHVVLACRNQEKAAEVASALTSAHAGSAEAMSLDLADLDSVQAFCKAFLTKHSKLNILVNNGGLNTDGKYNGPKTTKQGYEICFGTNFLGHFVLTMLLLPTMRATGPARIVNVSSITCWFASVKFKNYAKGPAKTRGNYAASKMALTVMGIELAAKMGDKATVIQCDPGFVASDIWRNDPIMRPIAALLALTTKQGARTSIEAATRTDLKNGCLLFPTSFKFSKILKIHGNFAYTVALPLLSKLFYGCKPDSYCPKAYKPEAADNLFELAFEICKAEGIKLPVAGRAGLATI